MLSALSPNRSIPRCSSSTSVSSDPSGALKYALFPHKQPAEPSADERPDATCNRKSRYYRHANSLRFGKHGPGNEFVRDARDSQTININPAIVGCDVKLSVRDHRGAKLAVLESRVRPE